jgi:hypothetical protein
MTIRADNDPKFSRRFLYMGIGALLFALYCVYDGFIGYPHKQEKALAFEKLYAEDRADEWEAYAAEQGWSAAIPVQPKTDDEYHGDILMQHAMAVVTGLIGVWLISIPLRARGRWIEASDTGITSSWGQSLNFADITAVDKRQWRSKGIARVTYNDNGRKRRFVIDDYKFDRDKTDEILFELEQRIDPELITGGPPETPPGEEVAEADAVNQQTEGG